MHTSYARVPSLNLGPEFVYSDRLYLLFSVPTLAFVTAISICSPSNSLFTKNLSFGHFTNWNPDSFIKLAIINKLSLWTPFSRMGGVKVYLHSSLTSALDGP